MDLTGENAKAFMQMAEKIKKSGALSEKFKELIAISLSVKAQCDDCITHHLAELIKLKATDEEINEAMWVAVMMGGGPSLAYLMKAQNELKKLRKQK
ncbi:MAG: carboxymuconolactone decarboxylase family protein [Candidatus Nanoarchaeia archaeon]|nr:carboxymuconolactone decarboxylase family protein [Candidatus Nanoarchaeia archaeon]MDD5053773.1 carboxymuconolactone decarboxylase family protein [Candidatus Nanoarchaeia archaeon]MDD5499386.1 carboxymuconolactone decarboxylase family protein [Candidatus Nanoarchaeia archaeon]